MSTDQLIAVVSLILALSIASERLVEIVKGWLPSLSHENPDPKLEARRKSALQMLAVVAGVATAMMAADYLPQGVADADEPWKVIGLGLLASGGSGLWNSILTYMLKLKDLKKVAVEDRKVT